MAVLSNLYSDLSTASDSGTGNGSTTDFVLSQKPVNTLDPVITLNGIKQRYTTDYSITLSTKTLSFVTAPAIGQVINATYRYI